MRHYALILAAGAASRMGRCKALLPLPFPDGDCCALERLARMYAFCGQRFVVTGHHAGLLEPVAPGWGLRAVRNPRPEDGMFSSICAGLQAVLEQARADGVEPEQGGVFVHPVDVPLTRRLTLLALPREDREQFLEEHNVVDMSARQLETAIRERDEALKAAQAAKADAATAEEARAKMAEDMAVVNASLKDARQERERADDQVRRLEAELAELKARPVDVAVETVVDQEAVAKARADAVAEIKEKLKNARSQRREAQEALAAVQAQLDRLQKEEKRAALSADKDLAMFEVLFTQGQELANKLHGLLIKARGREDQTAAQGMEKALRALAEAIGRCAE